MAGGTLQHLEQLIDGLTAGVILIDLSGTIVWCNDAALAMHGVDEAGDLGSTADEYATRFALTLPNGHRLNTREYPVMRALAGENIPDLTVRVSASGTDEPRWTHHVRDVVMTGDDEEPDCIALVLQDLSEQTEAEARFEAMFQANPAPALILRLADQRFVRANRGFLEMTGYGRTAVIGRSLYELDVLNEAERVEFARQRLLEGKTIPQMEAELPLPDGHTKLVILAGQPIEISDDKCMLFTFADLEPRRKAERSLRESEAHFSTLFRMAPVAMALTSPDDHRMIEANDAFWQLTGYSPTSFLGRAAGDPELWADVAERNAAESEIARAGGLRNRDVRLSDAEGRPVDCLLSAERMVLHGERCTLWLFQDITARRHSELDLVNAIEAVMKDASWFSRSVMDKLVNLKDPRGTRTTVQSTDLTPREREILELICGGQDDRVIAQTLSLSRNTVRNHVASIYGKIGVNRRAAAIAWARERGLT
ncbi:PAS domain S-box protein [Sphingomonas sp. PL-96]|uniref:PAS domain S-box protein n=1 Tax=Sphingomonas sp. PL-96 TaxID=2887201 RepID=UPI001E4DA03B|nr:PAS domain S-box protein [Sphingomonas sp. PL-96]MCC2978009.1 PAS domain S-box protein [Sphingomonas sp. PL-96]